MRKKTIKSILHIDMDCFFAAVEMRDDKSLRGKPVIVGGTKERGVISACSYEARKFGLHSAMPIFRAKQLCPNGIYISGNMAKYQEASKEVMNIFYKYTDLVEQLSIDEAFLDITGSKRLFGTAKEIAIKIKEQILEEVGLIASVGIASTKFIAKIASDMDKPNGLFIVPHDNSINFLSPLSISKMWGIGKVHNKSLLKLGIKTIKDIRKFPTSVLKSKFGENFTTHIKRLSNGIDNRNIEMISGIKSISHEHTFSKDTSDKNILRTTLLALTDNVMLRLRNKKLKCKTVFLKYRTDDFQRYSRQITLQNATDVTNTVFNVIEELLNRESFFGKNVRLIGSGVSGFDNNEAELQRNLFSTEEKSDKTDKVKDEIIRKYGKGSIERGTLIW